MTNALPISTGIGARGAKTIGGFGLVRPPITIAYQFWQCGRVMDTVGMVLITIAYHMTDLALTLLWLAFTNDYHRRVTHTKELTITNGSHSELAGLAVNTHMTEHDKWDRITLWTLRVVIGLGIVVAWLVVTGRIDAWLT